MIKKINPKLIEFIEFHSENPRKIAENDTKRMERETSSGLIDPGNAIDELMTEFQICSGESKEIWVDF